MHLLHVFSHVAEVLGQLGTKYLLLIITLSPFSTEVLDKCSRLAVVVTRHLYVFLTRDVNS
jgi:hypothetical protein